MVQCSADRKQSLVDRISFLPTDILIQQLLPLLTLKEAAATSILSKQWTGLWMYRARLDLDGHNILQKQSDLITTSAWYVDWVNELVKVQKAPVIDEFRVCFELDKTFQEDIDKWIAYALSKRVQTLELDFLRSCMEKEFDGLIASLVFNVHYCALVSLKIHKFFHMVLNVVLENNPMLVDVSVVGWLVRHIPPLLSSCLSRLEVLAIHVRSRDVREEKDLVQVPQLSSLKQLH
ncbi:OLC1v1028120C1 [Oldenlandia corymbosa var. corymbosa]|uniref:OLC1v1028120C1 n=1 Tax=Oldenlandia corymbosa var. corymbosa TaxID=529605 RepID=A0AAV1CDH7_OLDCO|nr:OLC1v1028120C1 [Oldenlandia corymbosa var. corymbosa]